VRDKQVHVFGPIPPFYIKGIIVFMHFCTRGKCCCVFIMGEGLWGPILELFMRYGVAFAFFIGRGSALQSSTVQVVPLKSRSLVLTSRN
jgi:hypothetical protein